MLNILFSFDHYSNILSSKTAALLLTGRGFLMALNAIRNKRYSLPFWIGVLEVIFGTFLCFKYFFVGLAFFITFFIGDMLQKEVQVAVQKILLVFQTFCACICLYCSWSAAVLNIIHIRSIMQMQKLRGCTDTASLPIRPMIMLFQTIPITVRSLIRSE